MDHVAQLRQVKSWGYQLQKLDIDKAAASPYDLLVIDYSLDGTEELALKPADLKRLTTKPDGTKRLVYAYLSIGEAEDYRWYWGDWEGAKPSWQGKENPDWEGNYQARFWVPEWQRIVMRYIDMIAAAGFDGIYIDKADVYEEMPKAKGINMKQEMAEFVMRICVEAHKQDLGVIMQNAEELLPAVAKDIDGFAKEELFFGQLAPQQPNHPDEIIYLLQLITPFWRDGKPVFVVEYLNDQQKIAKAKEHATINGFVPFISNANRELASL